MVFYSFSIKLKKQIKKLIAILILFLNLFFYPITPESAGQKYQHSKNYNNNLEGSNLTKP